MGAMPPKKEPETPKNLNASLEDLLDLQDIFELRHQVLQITDELQEGVEVIKERAKTQIAQLLANIAIPKTIVESHETESPSIPLPDEQLPAALEEKPNETVRQVAHAEKKLRGKLQNRILTIVEASDNPLTNGAVIEIYNQLYEKEPATYASISNTLNTLFNKHLIRRRKRGLYERIKPKSDHQERPGEEEAEKRISEAGISWVANTRKEKIFDTGALLLLRIRQAEIQSLLDDKTLFSGMESEIIEHRQEWNFADSQRLDIEQISYLFDLGIQEVQEMEHEALCRLHRLFEERHGQTVKSILRSEEAVEGIENLDSESLAELVLHRNKSKTLLAEKLLTIKGCRKDWYNLIQEATRAHCSNKQYEALDLLYGLSDFHMPGGVTKALGQPSGEVKAAWVHKRAALLAICEGAELEDPDSPLGKILAAVDARLVIHSTEKNQ